MPLTDDRVPAPESSGGTKRLLNRNILNLWIGQFISLCGDSALWAAIIFLVLALNPTDASFKAGFVAFLETFPFLLFGVFAGLIGDRFDRRRVMWISDIVRAGLLFSVPILFWFDLLRWWSVGIVAFGVGSFSAVFNPARDALVPDLVGETDLLRVNSFFQTTGRIAIVAGTGLAAVLLGIARTAVQTEDVPRLVMIFGLDGVTFLVSALFIFWIRLPPHLRGKSNPDARLQGHLNKIVKWVRKDSLLLGLLFITAVDNLFIMGPAIVGINLFARDTLSKGPEAVALLEFVLAGGMLLASAGLLKWGTRLPKGKLVLIGIILDGLTYLPYYWIRSYSVLLVAVFIHSLSIPLIIVPRTTLVQENVPRSRLSQAFSLINLTIFGFWSISGLLTGWLASFLTQFSAVENAPPLIFLIAGLGGTTCGIAGFFFKGLRSTR